MAWPIVRPEPVITLYTPSGSPASASTSARMRVVAEVTSDGFTTIVQPDARMKGTRSHRIRKESSMA